MSAIMLKKKYPFLKVISRLHGMDLYNERHVGGRQPFKKIMDLKTEKLVFACEYGMKYYIRQFTDKKSKSKSKYEVCRLGTDEIKKGTQPITTRLILLGKLFKCNSIKES